MTNYFLLLISLIASAIITYFAIPVIVAWSEKHGRNDQPNERKIHTIPISRLGGVCFFPTMILVTSVIVFLTLPWSHLFLSGEKYGLTILWRLGVVAASSLVLFVTGILDDMYNLNYKIKFLAQFAAALILGFGLCYSIYGLSFKFFAIIFLVVYIINAMNLIDGIDGLASGLGVMSLAVLMLIHAELGNWLGAVIASSLCGVLVVFFFYNVHGVENKIFMGDTGSLTIGLIIAYLVVSVSVVEEKISGQQTFFLPTAFATILMPMLDVVRVVSNRLFNRKNPFKADKTHVHHRLMDRGYTALQTLEFLLTHTAVIIILVYVGVVCYNIYLK